METIFVIDDSATNLAVVSEMLKNEYRTLTMPSAEKMFYLLERIIPKVILLDVEMPDTDGYKAIQILKENEKYKDIPVIFLTGNYDGETRNKCLSYGAVEVITKPFQKELLVDILKRYVN